MYNEALQWGREHWEVLGVGCAYLIRGWMAWRRRRWLERLLELQRREHISQQNGTIEIMSSAYSSGEPLTLEDLLSRAERDFSLRSSRSGSERHSTPPSGSIPESGPTHPFRRTRG